MPIFEIDEETSALLPEEVKAKLKPFEPEDVTGLKTKANELLAERKALAAKVKELQSASNSAQSDSADAKLADAMRKLEQVENEKSELKKLMSSQKLRSAAESLAAKATSDQGKMSILVEKLEKRLSIEGDSIVVLDQNGSPTISKPEELYSSMRKELPFLFDESIATGGGAKGGSGGAETSKTIRRSAFDSLGAKERIDFMAAGGKLID